jgi:stress response protein YsnF
MAEPRKSKQEITMARETIVALFPTLAGAQAASHDLQALGVPASDISVRAKTGAGNVVEDRAASAPQHEPGILDWLFGSRVPDDELSRYHAHLEERQGAVLSARIDSDDYDRIADLLERHDLVDIQQAQAAHVATPAGTPDRLAGDRDSPTAPQPASGTEQVISTAREELQVGKRQVQDTHAYRVRRYVVEQAVEEPVSLHSETVTVERRMPTQSGVGEGPFEEKLVEVTETREEPVVSKVVKPGEDVVIRKEAHDRVETVRDTVRETKVDVDTAAAGNKPGITDRGPR